MKLTFKGGLVLVLEKEGLDELISFARMVRSTKSTSNVYCQEGMQEWLEQADVFIDVDLNQKHVMFSVTPNNCRYGISADIFIDIPKVRVLAGKDREFADFIDKALNKKEE